MTLLALYIILGVLLLIFLILMIRVHVYASYTETLTLSVKALFVKIVLLSPDKKPMEKKPKKPKKKKKAKPKPPEDTEEEKKKKKKKPSYLSKLKDKKGLTGLLELFTGLAKIAVGLLKGVFSHIVIHKLDVGIAVSSGDAASTAVTYGRLCSVIYPSVNIITAATICKDYHITVEPVFDDEKETEVSAEAHASLRIIWAVWEALKAGVKLLIVRMKL